MIELEKLRVSLTKNGYLKLAEVVKRHPRWEVLDNIRGVYRGVNLNRSQAANILGEGIDGTLPEFWDEIRSESDEAVKQFTMVAIIMSHVDVINLLAESAQGDYKGHLRRGRIGTKAYTNLVYAMASCGLCDYERGAEAVTYDMRRLVYELREVGNLVMDLMKFKLRVCGWRPENHPGGTAFFDECEASRIHRVFSMEMPQFKQWLNNRLRIAAPTERTDDWPRISR